MLTTQDRPCPVHQSSEASFPSPRHPAGTPSPTRPYMGTFGCWVAGGSPGGPNATVPPPPRLPGWGLAQWLKGGGCPGVAGPGSVLGTAGTQVIPSKAPLVAGSLDSDSSFICLDSPHSHTCLSSGYSARGLWRPLSWPGHRPELDAEWRMAVMAAGGRACLCARGPWRGHTLLCSPQPWPWDRSWSPAPALVLAVHGPGGRRALRAALQGEDPVWLCRVGCWGPLFLSCAGFSSGPGLEGHGHAGRVLLCG